MARHPRRTVPGVVGAFARLRDHPGFVTLSGAFDLAAPQIAIDHGKDQLQWVVYVENLVHVDVATKSAKLAK
jgi:hypothetical protein